ncbi:MAG: hypothetical protein KatS3mg023_1809 [Armatimonadota bacterium]|nr:MAG: hypothetical protein KatS3mg023_1809 [Armatimonadota bacterium]
MEEKDQQEEQGCAEGCVTCAGCFGTLVLAMSISYISPILGIILFIGYVIYAADKHSK